MENESQKSRYSKNQSSTIFKRQTMGSSRIPQIVLHLQKLKEWKQIAQQHEAKTILRCKAHCLQYYDCLTTHFDPNFQFISGGLLCLFIRFLHRIIHKMGVAPKAHSRLRLSNNAHIVFQNLNFIVSP